MTSYYEIIQECRLELNYKPATSFASLTKNDDLKLKNAINRINKTIVQGDNYWFRQKKTTLSVDDSIEFDLVFDGKIIDVMEDTEHYFYEPDYTKFFDGTVGANRYGFFGGKILFPEKETATTITIYYLTNNSATDSTGATEKDQMALETDISLIPEKHRQNILVYGTCMTFKAMPSKDKYQHWSVRYIESLTSLRSECLNTVDQSPSIPMLNYRPTISPDSFRHIYG